MKTHSSYAYIALVLSTLSIPAFGVGSGDASGDAKEWFRRPFGSQTEGTLATLGPSFEEILNSARPITPQAYRSMSMSLPSKGTASVSSTGPARPSCVPALALGILKQENISLASAGLDRSDSSSSDSDRSDDMPIPSPLSQRQKGLGDAWDEIPSSVQASLTSQSAPQGPAILTSEVMTGDEDPDLAFLHHAAKELRKRRFQDTSSLPSSSSGAPDRLDLLPNPYAPTPRGPDPLTARTRDVVNAGEDTGVPDILKRLGGSPINPADWLATPRPSTAPNDGDPEM